jgi:MFS family permease
VTEPTTARTARRNFRLGLVNGIVFMIGEAFNDSGLVMALLMRQLGGSLAVVGLLPALKNGGWLLPQMIVGGRLQAQRYKLPVYRRSSIFRIIAYSAMVAAIFAIPVLPPEAVIGVILLCYAAYNLAGGTGSLGFQDVVAKVIPPRSRGRFFGIRQLVGGLLAFLLAGPLVQRLLAADSPLAFPLNFGVLAALSLVMIAIGLTSFMLIVEPPAEHVGPRLSLWAALRAAPGVLRRDHDYRWFIGARMLSRVGQIGEPFYVIYAVEQLQVPTSMVGIYLAVRSISAALSNLYWGRVSDRRGNRALLLQTGGMMALIPLLVLALPPLLGPLGASGISWGFVLVFLCIGAANDGANIAGLTYMMEIAPEAQRTSYIGFANTLLGIVTMLPVLGGVLVYLLGYVGIFWLGTLFSLLALGATLMLREPRLRAQVGVSAPRAEARRG